MYSSKRLFNRSIRKIKLLGLTIFVDTNGSLDFSKNPKLTELMDMAMLDVKSFDSDEHKMLTKKIMIWFLKMLDI